MKRRASTEGRAGSKTPGSGQRIDTQGSKGPIAPHPPRVNSSLNKSNISGDSGPKKGADYYKKNSKENLSYSNIDDYTKGLHKPHNGKSFDVDFALQEGTKCLSPNVAKYVTERLESERMESEAKAKESQKTGPSTDNEFANKLQEDLNVDRKKTIEEHGKKGIVSRIGSYFWKSSPNNEKSTKNLSVSFKDDQNSNGRTSPKSGPHSLGNDIGGLEKLEKPALPKENSADNGSAESRTSNNSMFGRVFSRVKNYITKDGTKEPSPNSKNST
jgi:hypothetical protein